MRTQVVVGTLAVAETTVKVVWPGGVVLAELDFQRRLEEHSPPTGKVCLGVDLGGAMEVYGNGSVEASLWGFTRGEVMEGDEETLGLGGVDLRRSVGVANELGGTTVGGDNVLNALPCGFEVKNPGLPLEGDNKVDDAGEVEGKESWEEVVLLVVGGYEDFERCFWFYDLEDVIIRREVGDILDEGVKKVGESAVVVEEFFPCRFFLPLFVRCKDGFFNRLSVSSPAVLRDVAVECLHCGVPDGAISKCGGAKDAFDTLFVLEEILERAGLEGGSAGIV